MKYQFTKPIDMPRGMHYGSDYWIVFSKKINRQVHLYSLNEYANYLELEMNHLVEYFCEQPLKAELFDDDKVKDTIFDFWVYYCNGESELQEVKPSEELIGTDVKSIRTQEQISKQRRWCSINNLNYKVITDTDLFQYEYRLQNLELLSNYSKRASVINNGYFKNMIKELKNNKVLSIKEILDMNILPNKREYEAISLYFFEGKISMNIDTRPLDYQTEVYLCQQEI